MIDLPLNKKIILFDGVCNLCDSSVQFIIKHDKKDIFRFASIQSDFGIQILKSISVDSSKTDSIFLYEANGNYFIKSEAAFKIAQYLGGMISLISVFRFLPKVITDKVYDFIAKNRYKWYGNKEACMVPTVALKCKFL